MMSEMMALNRRGCVFSICVASPTEPADTGMYPARFSRAQTDMRMTFSSSTTRITVLPCKSELFANGSTLSIFYSFPYYLF